MAFINTILDRYVLVTAHAAAQTHLCSRHGPPANDCIFCLMSHCCSILQLGKFAGDHSSWRRHRSHPLSDRQVPVARPGSSQVCIHTGSFLLTCGTLLAVYGVLPISCIFLVLYSYATQRFSRATLFNIVVSTFLALYAGFALLYPHHETMHLHGFATQMLENSPAGLAGAIGMVRNWMFTLFYCTSELWGDVVLSLLFWGLANETTSLRDAPLLYPLFGVGANVAQTLAGRILSAFSNTTASKLSYAQQVQSCMMMVLCLGVGILALHHYINVRFPHNYGDVAVPVASTKKRLTPLTKSALPQESSSNGASTSSSSSNGASTSSTSHSNGASSASITSFDEASTSAELHGNGRLEVSTSEAGRFQASPGVSSNSSSDASSSSAAQSPSSHQRQNRQGGRSKLGFKEAVVFLAKSPQIRCLAMMALAQGLTTNLLDVAWKQHLHMLHPSPAAYSVSACPPGPLHFRLPAAAACTALCHVHAPLNIRMPCSAPVAVA